MSDDPIVEAISTDVGRAGLLLWRLNQEVGVYSGAKLEFSLQLASQPWPITLMLDDEGDVVWPGDGNEVRVVVYADGRLARES